MQNKHKQQFESVGSVNHSIRQASKRVRMVPCVVPKTESTEVFGRKNTSKFYKVARIFKMWVKLWAKEKRLLEVQFKLFVTTFCFSFEFVGIENLKF